jgi:hypothetical protein
MFCPRSPPSAHGFMVQDGIVVIVRNAELPDNIII